MKAIHALLIPAAIAGATLLTLGASAQVMKNHDSNAPVNFTADRIEVQDRADRVVVSGNVQVTQAGMTLNSARMTVAYRQGGGGASGIEIDRIDASGNVVVTRGNETARGNVAIYDLNSRIITMLGNVALNQGANRLTGGRLVIDLASGRSTVDGRASAGGTPGVAGGGGRVSGTFTVPQRSN
ncbi:LptA/OstA family protein [Sphingobium sp. AN641]|uniref:LptA/OstA family protein n=1 Tax=Sphingobium sp. AN641 TaxID=3133443 RepID=UPI0030BE1272